MAVDTTVFVANGLYTPFQTKKRGANGSPVGTLYVDVGAAGAAGGGTVTAALAMRRIEFGMVIAWIVTGMAVSDTLVTAEAVQLAFFRQGNVRLASEIVFSALPVAVSGQNAVGVEPMAVPIEGVNQTQADIFKAIWSTNTDTKGYHVHLFGPVYDLELIAKSGYVPDLLAGIR